MRGHYLISTSTLAGLKAIGGPGNPTPGTGGTFAAIGVPGMAAGNGWSAGGPGPGRLTGYATQDTWGNWTYTAGDPVAFDTNPGSGPNGSSISVGNHTYTLRKLYSEQDDGCSLSSKIPSPAPAAQLLVVNRFTLAPVLNRVYAVNSVCSVDAMVRALNAVNSDQIALLNDSDGVRTTSAFPSDQGAPWFAARERLAVAVERLGGVATRSRASKVTLASLRRRPIR